MSKLALFFFLVFIPFILFAQNDKPPKGESLKLEWPESDHWKVGGDLEEGPQHITNFIHDGETLDKWTELGNMTSLKGMLGISVDTAMYVMFLSAVAKAPDAKLAVIKKGETQDCPWIIFSIEAPEFKKDTIPESQLWFLIQGKQGLYTNFVATKQPKLPEDFKQKWTTFFEKGRLVYN